MIITPVLALEEMRFPLEILSAALVFLLPFAEKKERFRPKMIGWFVFFTLFALLYFPIFLDKDSPRFWMLQGVWYAFFSLCPVLYAKLCFDIGWVDALFLDISAFAAQNIVYSFVNLYLARVEFPRLREHLLLYVLLSAAACGLVFGIIWRLYSSHLSRCGGRLFEDTPKNLIFYTILFSLTIVCLFYYQNLFEHTEGFYAVTSWIPGLLYSVLLLTIQYSLFRMQNFSSENEILEQMLHNSERYYEMSKENIEIINRKCHDLKHQLKILEMVGEEERQQYIEEARGNLAFYQQLVHSENPVINTILAEKGLFCEERGIALSCSVDDADLSFIKVTDLYAMLGNALDNAVNYVEQFKEEELRVITFRISEKHFSGETMPDLSRSVRTQGNGTSRENGTNGITEDDLTGQGEGSERRGEKKAAGRGFLNIQVVNPYQGPQLAPGELPLSTQDNGNGKHGYGLKSIRYLAQKYGGGMEISTGDDLFTLQITIPLGG